MREVGVYKGGSGWLSVVFKAIDGSVIIPNASDIVLKVHRPNGSLFQTFTAPSIQVKTEGEVLCLVEIPEDEVTGVWVAEWIYNDSVTGKPFKVEMPFVVSDVDY
jgi:uncharacterized protein YfaS (alpha-2-macroglobulin family)